MAADTGAPIIGHNQGPPLEERPTTRTIFRNASPANPYTQILTATLQDDKLSAKALAILVFVLSLPHDWRVCLEHVAKRRKLGRDATRRDARRRRGTHTGRVLPPHSRAKKGRHRGRLRVQLH